MKRKIRGVWRLVGWTAIGLIALVAAATPLVLSLPQFGGELSGQRLERARRDPHFRDGRFVNPLPPAPFTFGYVRELIAGQLAASDARVPARPLPVVPVTAASLLSPAPDVAGSVAPQRLRAFW